MSQKKDMMDDMSEFFISLLLANGPGRFKLSAGKRAATVFRITEENKSVPMLGIYFTPAALKECMQVWNSLSHEKLVHYDNDIIWVD